ncbi:MAG: hypothetical protein HY744_08540 [Deltaproteobacteria bacterium]|nr:hypothetical protein [Deltaproteobacteria bacterium]
MTTVGLLGPADDAEVAVLAARLAHRGVRPWIVDLARFPASLRISWGGGGVRLDGRPLGEMDAAYLRRVGTALPAAARYDAAAGGAVAVAEGDAALWRAQREPTVAALRDERARHAVRTAVVERLARERPVVNPPRAQSYHRLKPWLLLALGRQGLPVPEWCCGSGGEACGRFAARGRARWGEVVDKPPAGIYKTELWTEQRFAAHRFGRRPALYQRLVRGDTVRCYVLGGQLLGAARIVHGAAVDSSLDQTGIEVVELSADEQRTVERAAQLLGLDFLGLDLQRDARTGESFLLDCNLSPMFASWGRLSQCDVAGRLADHLIACAAGRAGAAAPRPGVLDLVDEAKALFARDADIAALLGAAGRRQAPGGGTWQGP